jgi:hypothetical protein
MISAEYHGTVLAELSLQAARNPLPSLRLFTSQKAGAASVPKMYKAASWPEPRKHDAPLEG